MYSVGSLLGIMFSPDLDVDAKNVSSTIMRKKVGWFAEKAWDVFWYWYRRSLKHGSPLSHFPIISTLGRIFYIFLLIIVVPEFLLKLLLFPNMSLMYELTWWINILLVGYKIVIGLMASDLLHWALDISTVEHRSK